MRSVLLSTLALLACTSAAATPVSEPKIPVLTAKQRAQCERLGIDFARTGKILKLYRAFKGPDGNSKIETIDIEGKIGSYYNGSVTLTQFGLADPSNVVIVYGHPNLKIAPHPSPYREIFLIVSGSSTIDLPDGTHYDLKPGQMLL